MGVYCMICFLILITSASAASESEASDEICLSQLYGSFKDPKGSLQNWTRPNFANPCSGFSSSLSGATCNNGRVYKLSLTNLGLEGSISPSVSNCTNLQSLDLSSNSLTGRIPKELQYLVNLAVLNLSSNMLQGDIPPELYLCSYLNVIDLHNNALTGQIPQQLGSLVRLSAFDVSDNKLSGSIPPSLGNRSRSLPVFNASSFQGNKELFGYPLAEKRSKKLSVLTVALIGVGSGLASLVISLTLVCTWTSIFRRKKTIA